MMKRCDKTGQFYLLAAIVIIALVIGILSITNYSSKKENSRVYELAEELEIESSKILDLGAVTGNYPWDSFTRNFTNYAGKDINIIYAIGNLSDQDVFRYNEIGEKEMVLNYFQDPKVIVTLEQTNYTFTFKPGQNFYFIIAQKIGGDKYVATNE